MDQLAGRYSIFPSGYCRFTDPNQEKDIQDRIRGILPVRLNATPVPIPKNDWALFICSSAVEEILEQSEIVLRTTTLIKYSLDRSDYLCLYH